MSNDINQYAGCKVIDLDRFTLRPLVLSDNEAIFKLRSHPDTFKYVNLKPYADIPRAERFIRAVQLDIEDEEAYFWGIALKDSDYLIGTICLWNFSIDYSKAELGYELHPDYQKKGFMREAVRVVLEFARAQTQLQKLEAITHKDNIPSRNLLDHFGFKCLGIADEINTEVDEGPDMMLYEWLVEGR